MKFRKYIYASLAALVLVACSEDTIEIKPENSVTPEIALKRTSGINSLTLSAYRRVHEFTYYGQQYILNAEALADNLQIANNTGRYTGQVVNAVGSHFTTWSDAPYRIINDCNIVLKYVDVSSPALGQTEAQAAPLRARYKGEALFLRALAYHDLARVYGYEPGREVGGFNLAIILRTTPTEKVTDADKRARATNTEIYSQIKSDLTAAIALLPAESTLIAAEKGFRASKSAAKALLARVLLYNEEWAAANTMATEALAETAKTIVPAANYFAAFGTAVHPEAIFEAEIRTADWSTVDGVNNSLASITNRQPTGLSATESQFAVAASDELIAAFEAGDVRRTIWVVDPQDATRFSCKKWQGEKGNYLENVQIIRTSEVALIAAEARAKSTDEAGARTILNDLRSKRGLAATAATGQALLDLILNERRVELCFEGHRFFDLKRLGMDLPKPAELGIAPVPYTDYRILAGIPNNEVTYNSTLQQNPNY